MPQNTQNRCLYIVDVQKGFIAKEAVLHIPAIVEALQADYEHVIASCFYNPPVSPYRERMGMQKMNAGCRDVELAFTLKEGGIGVYKSHYSGDQSDVFTYLQKHRITQVDVCGVNTECCVLLTATGLFERGLEVRLLGHASGSSLGQAYHEAGLLAAESCIGAERVLRVV